MQVELVHKSKFQFESRIREHVTIMDTKESAGGDNAGPTPKELMLASVLGCTGMDIVAVLKKYRIIPRKLVLKGDAEPRSAHPRVFNSIQIIFEAEDDAITSEMLINAAHESMTKFCGVSAMVSKVVPIYYKVILNGTEVGHGQAKFDI